MPRAEPGSTKHLSNKLKSKGLQRLRWYCQVCERQMRDENGFKCHTQSESHVRQMMIIGENPRAHIHRYSSEFLSDFIKLLRTGHGEKKVHINQFYQEYIANKEHIHMNATRWASLSEFARFLGREGICRVEEGEKGLFISWIDNSPATLRRQDAVRKKERQDRGEEEREQRMIRDQIRRAQRDHDHTHGQDHSDNDPSRSVLQRTDGQKIKLGFGLKKQTPSLPEQASAGDQELTKEDPAFSASPQSKTQLPNPPSKPKNVFAAAAKKNSLAGESRKKMEPQKPLTTTEQIMKDEMDRKKRREPNRNGLGFGVKKQKIA